jgi:hypothetical protein
MKRQSGFRRPSLHLFKRSFGFFSAPAQNDKVIRVSHHLVSKLAHLVVQLIQVDVTQQRADDSTNNVVKTVLEFVTSIPRERLRTKYGQGFLGAPLTTENSQQKVTRQDRGVRSESTTPEERAGGESDV